MTRVVEAYRKGTCPFCDDPIHLGDVIAFDETEQVWGHAYDCVEVEEEKEDETEQDFEPKDDYSSFIDDLNLSSI